MRYSRIILARLLLAAAVGCGGATCGRAEEVSLTPQARVLLLNNGEVIEGTITAAGDRYDVHLKDGEIRVKRASVARVCRNLRECYSHKRAAIEAGQQGDHLELAEWCLRHGLNEEAELEIASSRITDAGHPKIRLLEARLRLAREQPVRHEPAPAQEKPPTTENLDTLARSLPAGSMECFTNSIQPMLLNYCSKSGCHSAASGSLLRMERISRNRLAGRHPTQRNLQSVLRMIDRDSPEQSKLLLAVIQPHGTLKSPVFNEREQSQYKQLLQWVYLVSGTRLAPPAPTLEERTAPLSQVLGPKDRPPASAEADADATVDANIEANAPAKAPGNVEVEPDTAAAPPDRRPAARGARSATVNWLDSFPDQRLAQPPANVEEQPPARGSRGARATARATARPVEKTAAPPGEGKDPFDPEIFNRRFFAAP